MMTFNNPEESFDFVAKIKSEGGYTENGVASAIRILALITIIGGLILGFILGKDPYYDEFSFALAVTDFTSASDASLSWGCLTIQH